MKRRSLGIAVISVLAVVTSTWAAPAMVDAEPVVARDAGVIVEWNEITERTLDRERPADFRT